MDKKEIILTIAKDILVTRGVKGVLDAELKKQFDSIVKIIEDAYISLKD